MVFAVGKLASSFGIALVSAGTAVGVALSSATPAIAQNQALMINGIGGLGLAGTTGGVPLPKSVMYNVLGGDPADILMLGPGGEFATYNLINVPWPMQAAPVTGKDDLTLTQSVADGVTNLDALIATALTKIGPGEHVTVVGLSAGSLVADEELRKLATDPHAPDKSKLTFVVVADSGRSTFNANRFDKTLGYQYQTAPETKYNTVVVTAEYDGFADFPDRVWNILAVANAYVGEILNHVPSVFTDLSKVDPSNITVTTNSLGGVTTNYFIPSAHLPLVELLPFLAPQEQALKAIIDTAYKRNDGKSAASTPAVAAAAVAGDTANTPEASPQANATASPVADQTPAANAPAETKASTPVKAVASVSAEAPAADPVTTPAPTAAAASADSPRPTARRAAARSAAASAGGHRASAPPARSAAASRAAK